MSDADDRWALAVAALQLSTRVIDDIQAGVRVRGFHDVTPLHGFAFARIAQGGAKAKELADHLGVSKQAAAQLVDRLVRAGYVERFSDPRDRRARLLRLTSRGEACTIAARAAAEGAVQRWRDELPDDARAFESALLRLTADISALRPPG